MKNRHLSILSLLIGLLFLSAGVQAQGRGKAKGNKYKTDTNAGQTQRSGWTRLMQQLPNEHEGYYVTDIVGSNEETDDGNITSVEKRYNGPAGEMNIMLTRYSTQSLFDAAMQDSDYSDSSMDQGNTNNKQLTVAGYPGYQSVMEFEKEKNVVVFVDNKFMLSLSTAGDMSVEQLKQAAETIISSRLNNRGQGQGRGRGRN
jgi:hypothetical protein